MEERLMERGGNYDQQYQQQQQSYQDNQNNKNYLSTIALILSIVSCICCCTNWLFSIPAIICAVIALVKNKKDIFAWVSIVISTVSIIASAILLVLSMPYIIINLQQNVMQDELDLLNDINSTTGVYFDIPNDANSGNSHIDGYQ